MIDHNAAESSAPQHNDPHQSKLPPDHPGLKLARSRARTLRKGPALAAAFGLLGVVLLSLILALSPATSEAEAHKENADEMQAPMEKTITIPDVIRNAPENATPTLPDEEKRAVPQLGPPVPTTLAPEGMNNPQGTGGPGPAEIRAQELAKARTSGLFVNVDEPATTETDVRIPAANSGLFSLPPNPTSSTASPTQAAQQGDQNLQDQKQAFVAQASRPGASDYVEDAVARPRSPFEVKAGTIIPTVLLTGINSDLPGQIVAQVRENVYDTVSGNYLLIPQGSRLLAVYDSAVAFGQDRALVCWQRLIRPDGTSINLQCMPGVDLAGQSGFADEVNNHWSRIIGGVVLSSFLAAGAASSQGSINTRNPSFPQLWAGGAANQISQTGQQITQKNLNIQPTITVRPGFSVNVLVNKDLLFPGPYAAGSR